MSAATVVVPNWNGRRLLESLLDSLAEQTHPIQEIVVIDDGSTDGSAASARARGARVIELGSNRGFAAAVNRGIQETRTEWIAIVNNDVQPERDWLERLAGALAEPGVWFATGKLLSAAAPSTIDGTYDLLSRGACAWRAGNGRPDAPPYQRRRRIRLAPLTAALFRAEMFQRTGLLDPRFETYLEDVDLGVRCALHGCAGVYEPSAVARHMGSATMGVWHPATVRRISRNQLFLVAKYYGGAQLLRAAWAVASAQALWGLVALRHGAGLAWIQGKIEGLAAFGAMHRSEARTGTMRRRLERLLALHESELRRQHRGPIGDWYWRLYFAINPCL